MRIGLLIPHIYSSRIYQERIFAPLSIGVRFADTLVEKGHQVFFYTSRDVQTKATVIPGDYVLSDTDPIYYQIRYRDPEERKWTATEIRKRDFEFDLTLKAYKDAKQGKLDIIHSFHDFGAHYFDDLTGFPTVYTLHDPLPQDQNTIEYRRFSKFAHHNYISISNAQRKSILSLNFIATIYHGLALGEYEFNAKPKDYLIYFGRIIQDKGVDLAIQAALQTGLSLLIASSKNAGNNASDYMTQKVLPFIDGNKIKMVGYLEREAKSDFIKNAKAFVFPVQWEEPFGLTVIEAMACGTPVIAFRRGSMPELIIDGKTGIVVDPILGQKGIEQGINNIASLNREACRKQVEENFTLSIMADKYIDAYKKVITV